MRKVSYTDKCKNIKAEQNFLRSSQYLNVGFVYLYVNNTLGCFYKGVKIVLRVSNLINNTV